jgi:hypothetical protein
MISLKQVQMQIVYSLMIIFPAPMKPNPSVHPTQKENAPTKEINKLPAWLTATSKLTEIEVQQQYEIARLTEEQAQTAQVTSKANQIIEAQQAKIEELKAQQTVDNEKPSKEALEAKTAQSKEATQLLKELQEEMKSMMQQFMESFKVPLEAKTPESNKQQINTTEAVNDNPPSEKRQDNCTTPVKLFPKDIDLRDPARNLDTMVADNSNDQDYEL